MRIRFALALSALVTFVPAAFGEGKVTVKGAVVPNSTQAYTGDTGTFEVAFQTSENAEPASVVLRYAFAGRNGSGDNTDWANEDIVEMKKISKGVFKAVFADAVAARGALRYTKLNFVFLVRVTPHERRVQNGAKSALGHYQVEVPYADREEVELKLDTVEK